MKLTQGPDLEKIQQSLGFEKNPTSIGDVINDILPYIYSLAGIVLLLLLISGGIGLMTAAGDPKKVESSQKRITSAIIGVIIIFISFFVVQFLSRLLGIERLNIFN